MAIQSSKSKKIQKVDRVAKRVSLDATKNGTIFSRN